VKDLIKRNLNGKKVLIYFGLTGLVYGSMLGITGPKVMMLAGGMRILDLMPTGYDAYYVKTLFGALGEEGRHAYLFNQLPLDLIFPFLSGISFCLIIAWLLGQIKKLETNWFYLCYLPVIAGLFDYFENFSIITLLMNYPDISENMVKLSSVFSILKSSFTTVYMIIMIILLVVFGVNKIFLKREKIS
jgi:hypothetical protein